MCVIDIEQFPPKCKTFFTLRGPFGLTDKLTALKMLEGCSEYLEHSDARAQMLTGQLHTRTMEGASLACQGPQPRLQFSIFGETTMLAVLLGRMKTL